MSNTPRKRTGRKAPTTPPDFICTRPSRRKPDPDAWLERAAIAEYDGELSREQAEALADEREPGGQEG